MTQFRTINYGSDHSGAPPITNTGTFTNVEYLAGGAVVADGVLLDMRGADMVLRLRYEPNPSDYGATPSVEMYRNADGDLFVEVINCDNTAVSNTNTYSRGNNRDVVIQGTGSQTITSTLDGSVSLIQGLRNACEDLHEALNGITQRLNDAAAWHPTTLVNEGHQWIYWGGHMACYQVAHNTTLSLPQRIAWAKTSKAIVDRSTGDTLYDTIDAATEPTAPVGVVNPNNSQLVGFTNPVSLTGGDYGSTPDPSALGNGKWIAQLSN